MKRQDQWAKKNNCVIIASEEYRAIYVHKEKKCVIVLHKEVNPGIYYRGQVIMLHSSFRFHFRTQGRFKSLLESIDNNSLGQWYFDNKSFVSNWEI